MGNNVRHLACLLVVLAILGLSACQSAEPIGPSTPLHLDRDEQRLWLRVKEEEKKLDRSGLLYQDTQITSYVNHVAAKLFEPARAEGGIRIQVKILKNPLLNAFAYPNGVIYVHSGILARMENEAQLATLLGHELTHATHRHAIRSQKSAESKMTALNTLQAIVAPLGVFGAVAVAMGAVGYMASVTGYSRDMEREADREGIELMVRAGYAPGEAPKLFEYLKKDLDEDQRQEPFFFGTHPKLQDRIDNYQEVLSGPHAGRDGERGAERYVAMVKPLILDNADLDLALGRYRAAIRAGERVLTLDPNNARAYFVVGESLRRRGAPEDQGQARLALRQAVTLDSTFADPHKSLGLLSYKEGNKPEAADSWERYLMLAPNAPDRGHMEHQIRLIRSEEGGRQ